MTVETRATAAAAALALCSCAAILDGIPISQVKDVLTSSGGPADGGAPARDLWLLEYALVEPLVLRPYAEPRAAARCWDEWLASPRALDALFALGLRRDAVSLEGPGASPLAARMSREALCGARPDAAAGLPFFDCGRLATGDLSVLLRCPGDEADRRLLAYSVLQVGDALYGQRASMWPGHPTRGGPGYHAYREAIVTALKDAAALLARPTRPDPEPGRLPSLALSGGAANGAFEGGFLYRLFSIREQALADPATTPAARAHITSSERFGAVVSTSVGSLLAPLVDLYFDDVRLEDPAAPPLDADTTRACLGTPTGPGEAEPPAARAAQGCALRLMRRYLTRTHDWHLLCVEDASLRQLLGFADPPVKVANALAFDPLRDLVLGPFFDAFGARVLTNDVVVEQMAVEVEQRVALALDERVCAALPEAPARHRCLLDATMASLVEPFLARHVPSVWGALRGPTAGQWVDGGLRSGTPSLRALQLTEWPLELGSRTAVLAVSTHRAQGTPTTLRETLPALAFDTVGTLADQLRSWELALTGSLAEVQRQELNAWSAGRKKELGPAPPRLAATAMRAPFVGPYPAGFPVGGVVDSVVLPENVDFGQPIASQTLGEYAFDPVVMTQLFVQGEVVAVTGLDRRLADLGWTEVAAWYAAHRDAVEGEVRARWELVKAGPADAAAYQAAAASRRAECLVTCQKGGARFPPPSASCQQTLPEALLDRGRPPLPW